LSTYIVPDFLKRAKTMARPTAASAAATAITKNTKICPAGFPRNEEKATKVRLTEFNIISIDINMIITFLLVSTPIVPRINKKAEISK
jgi:hypothetical protein